MPSQALALAFAASIYPPAVAAVIALGRGPQLRSRVAAFVVAAVITTYAVGALLLFVLVELGVTSSNGTPSGGVDLALGVALLALAVHLRRRRPADAEPSGPPAKPGEEPAMPSAEPAKPKGPSKIDRYLQSRRLAFVLGVTLYVLPSPIFIAAVKDIADAKLSTSSELAALVATVAVMLWLIELPMLMLLVVPDRASSTLESLNAWFARNGRMVAVIASAAVGVYLVVKGIGELTG